MNIRHKWTLYFLVTFLTETCVFALAAHQLKPFEAIGYSLFLGGLFTLILLLPSYILAWLGTKTEQMNIKRAVGTGFLMWSLILCAHVLVLWAIPNARLLIYGWDVLVGLLLLWYFKFPYTLAILPVIFPGISLLYFLIYGQIRVRK